MAVSMGAFAVERTEVALNPAVDEMIEHLAKKCLLDWEQGREVRRINYKDGGFRRTANTKEEFQRLLKPRKLALHRFMSEYPREEGETIDAYAKRLSERGYADNWDGHLYLTGEIAAHIARFEDEEADARWQAKREEEAEEARRHAATVKASAPDRKEIDRLLAKIEDARDGEKLLSSIAAALAAHHAAQAARKELTDIFDRERRACATLGKRAPSRPKVPDAPDGARGFASSLEKPIIKAPLPPSFLPR